MPGQPVHEIRRSMRTCAQKQEAWHSMHMRACTALRKSLVSEQRCSRRPGQRGLEVHPARPLCAVVHLEVGLGGRLRVVGIDRILLECVLREVHRVFLPAAHVLRRSLWHDASEEVRLLKRPILQELGVLEKPLLDLDVNVLPSVRQQVLGAVLDARPASWRGEALALSSRRTARS